MILINLLPHREERRKRRKQAFFAGLAVAAVIGLAVVAGWYLVLGQMKAAQEERNTFLGSEIRRLEDEIKDVAALRAEIDRLKARQKVVEDFQIDRNMPVHMLNELVKQTPEGVYLTSIRQDGQAISLTGIAQTNERVSEFLRNTAYNSPWLQRPELVEIRAGVLPQGAKNEKRLFEFSMRLSLKRPQDKEAEAKAPAGSASGPARAASAAPKP